MTMQPSVECKPYERTWRNWAVDQNLDDHWLERLNNLETFSLVGICEGHTDAKPASLRRCPRIALMLRKAYMRPLTEQWYDLKETLTTAIERTWPDKETIIEFSIQHRLAKNDDLVEEIEAIIIRIISERKRDTMLLPKWTNHWFRHALLRIEAFDQFMKTLIIFKRKQ